MDRSNTSLSSAVELDSPLQDQDRDQGQPQEPPAQSHTDTQTATEGFPPPSPPGRTTTTDTQDLRRQSDISPVQRQLSPLPPIPLTSASPQYSYAADRDRRRDTKLSFHSADGPLPPLPEDITVSPRVPVNVDSHPDPRSIPLGLNPRRTLSLISGNLNVNEPFRPKTAGERLDPTLITAIAEKDKYAFKARLTGFALNAAIGMQVVLGALTTGLSVVTTGHQTQIMTAILGGFATIVASYLARARGSNEPELSITRVKDLEQFIRDCEAFKMDKGHVLDDSEDEKILEFRRRFEDLLGNASGERKLSA